MPGALRAPSSSVTLGYPTVHISDLYVQEGLIYVHW